MHVMYLLVVSILCYMVLLCYATCSDHALYVRQPLVQVSGRIEYLVAPFWKQKYCRKHDDSNTPRCCSCNRLKTSGQLWLTLSDERMVCQDCSKTVVQDTQQAQPLYDDVRLQRHRVVFVWSFVCCSLFWKFNHCVTMPVHHARLQQLHFIPHAGISHVTHQSCTACSLQQCLLSTCLCWKLRHCTT